MDQFSGSRSETHPLNLYDVAKYTGKSSLIFENFEVHKAFVYDARDVNKKDINVETDADKIDVGILELAIDFEVLDLNKIEVTDKHYIFEFGGLSSAKFNNEFAMFIIKFDRVIVCWNELICDAWFVKF